MHSGISEFPLPIRQGTAAPRKPDIESIEDLFARAAPLVDTGAGKSPPLHERINCRAVFLSDFHLGSASCVANSIVRFLDHVEMEYLFLIGDIIDCWQIGGLDLFKIHRQDRNQTRVLQKLLKLERRGVKIIYIPGNHDEYFRNNLDKDLPVNNLAVVFEATHDTADGRRFLIVHGDIFDAIIRIRRWILIFGTHLYERLVKVSVQIDKWRAGTWINRFSKLIGLQDEWSLAQALRDASNEATYGDSYEKTALAYLSSKNADIEGWNKTNPKEAQLKRYDGLLCAHTHIPFKKEILQSGDPVALQIFNTGCWVARPNEDGYKTKTKKRHPDCTAIIESLDGKLSHVQWVSNAGIVTLHPGTDGYFGSSPHK